MTIRFEPDPACAAAARRFVTRTLDAWGADAPVDELALCVTELATNAILHSRTPFTVAVRPAAGGVRVDVQDDRPDRLPAPFPDDIDPLQTGATGRGLRLVARLSTRWGFFTTDVAKTVWVEVGPEVGPEASAPLVELAARPVRVEGPRIRLLNLPVRAAVASGVQVDELVRELQLDPDRLSGDEQTVFYKLLERSAAPRLIGRHQAFRAAGEGSDHYDVELAIGEDEFAALQELVAFLEGLSGHRLLQSGGVGPDVVAMRAWLSGEVAAQYQGRAPTPYPGAASAR